MTTFSSADIESHPKLQTLRAREAELEAETVALSEQWRQDSALAGELGDDKFKNRARETQERLKAARAEHGATANARRDLLQELREKRRQEIQSSGAFKELLNRGLVDWAQRLGACGELVMLYRRCAIGAVPLSPALPPQLLGEVDAVLRLAAELKRLQLLDRKALPAWLQENIP